MYVRPGHKSGCIVRRGGLPSLSLSSSLGLARTKVSDRPARPPNGIRAAKVFLVHVSASSLDASHHACLANVASFHFGSHLACDYFAYASFRELREWAYASSDSNYGVRVCENKGLGSLHMYVSYDGLQKLVARSFIACSHERYFYKLVTISDTRNQYSREISSTVMREFDIAGMLLLLMLCNSADD